VPQSAVQLITKDHREMESVFEQLEKDKGKRAELVRKVGAMLLAHSKAEESEVYGAAREEAGERDEIQHSLEEHQKAEQLLHELERLDPSGSDFDAKLRELVSAVQEHVQEEESDVLPKLEERLDAKRLEELGRAFEERRGKELRAYESKVGGSTREDMTKEQLYEQAREADIPGRSTMSKDELAERLTEEGR